MATPKTIPAADLAALAARAAEIRKRYAHKPTPDEVIGPEGMADGIPYWFELQTGIRRLREAREAAGLTHAVVAEVAGLTPETISRLETGKLRNPTWQTLARYAVAVGCDIGLTIAPRENN